MSSIFYFVGKSLSKLKARRSLMMGGLLLVLVVLLVGRDPGLVRAVSGADFSLSSNLTTLTGGLGTSMGTITATSILGFSGTVLLGADIVGITGPPNGLTASFFPTSLTLAGNSMGSILSLTAVSPGSYHATVTGTSGQLSHSVLITVYVVAPNGGDFLTSLNPGSLSIQQGSSGTSNFTVTETGGFIGTIALYSGVSPAGPTVSVSPDHILGGYGSSTVTVNVGASVALGSYAVTISGYSGILTHASTLTVMVTPPPPPDFGGSLSKSTASVKQGSVDTSTITISSIGGFTGTVQLSASVYPAGPTVTLSPSNLPGGSGSATITVNVGNSVATGSYTVTITATSGSLSHSKQETVTVTQGSTQSTSSAPPSPIFGLDPMIFYALVGGIIVLVLIAGTIVALRMRKPGTIAPKTSP